MKLNTSSRISKWNWTHHILISWTMYLVSFWYPGWCVQFHFDILDNVFSFNLISWMMCSIVQDIKMKLNTSSRISKWNWTHHPGYQNETKHIVQDIKMKLNTSSRISKTQFLDRSISVYKDIQTVQGSCSGPVKKILPELESREI
jgi:hypothetical protein